MMRATQILSGALALHLIILSIHCLPVPERKTTNRYKATAGWLQKSHQYTLKKRGRPNHPQDTLKVKEGSWDKGDPAGTAFLKNGTKFWNRPRCGVPDYPAKKGAVFAGRQRQKRFVLFGADGRRLTSPTSKGRLSRDRPLPWQMSEDKVRRVLMEALRVWSDVTPLTFSEVTSGKADIMIDFTRYWHGDNLPFDGPGGILAHAFFPRTHRAGDIHFDYDETWTVGNSMGTDLLQVAAHEFGHVLGLQHSLVPGAVMSPFYSFSYPLQLSEDDKQGIQYLYGSRRTTAPHVSTETNEIDVSTPDACHTDFDAVSMIRGELFFFKSRYVWRIRDGQLQEGYPALASRHWRGIPENIDAAFEDKSGNIWFFQGQNYWVFDAERQITGPDSLQSLGLPVSDIQAALMWGEDKSQKIYFFKSGSYWRFNPQENRVDTVYPRNMQDWRGIPNDIDGAFQDRYGYAHFLSGRHYWKFDPVEVKVLEGYPRYIGMDFLAVALPNRGFDLRCLPRAASPHTGQVKYAHQSLLCVWPTGVNVVHLAQCNVL